MIPSKASYAKLGVYRYKSSSIAPRSLTHDSGKSINIARSWSQKTFGKIEDGSMRVAIFTLVASSMEIGCLSLPLVLKYLGIIPGITIIFLSSFVAYISMNGIALAAERRNTFDYQKLVADLLGTSASVILDVILILYLFSSVSAYQLIANESIISSLSYFDFQLRPYIYYVMIGYSLVIIFPLSLLPKFDELKIFSFISIAGIVFICTKAIFDFPESFKESQVKAISYYNFDINFASAISFALFSYSSHLSVATVFSDMRDPNKRRIKTVNFRVCFVQLGIFLVLGIIGYLSYIKDTPIFIVKIDPFEYDSFTRSDMLTRMIIFVLILVTIPFFIIICRQSIQNLVNMWVPVHFSEMRKLLINVGIIVGSTLLSELYDEILVIFNFLAATCAIFSFLIPILLEVASSKKRYSFGNVIKLGLMVIVSIISFASVFISMLPGSG